MVREDFTEILEYVTVNSPACSLNTNGTLITPRIAGLMKQNRLNNVAMYGATAEVHDQVTRTPGSFDAMLRGLAYLKEAGTDFTVQIFPMKANFHQYEQMLALADSLGRRHTLGGAWLNLSASGNIEKNREIRQQRLGPAQVVQIDQPDIQDSPDPAVGGGLLTCLETKRDFHVNPYGQMTFCPYIKDEDCLYDLRKGNFQEGWEYFIPAMGEKLRRRIQADEEYLENCGSCVLRSDCRWCPAYGFLEHRRFSAKVDYLCEMAGEARRFKVEWAKTHRAFFRIADITIQVDSDLPVRKDTFHSKFEKFRVDGKGDDTITLLHHFGLPDFSGKDPCREVYRKSPWVIYRRRNSWIYTGISDPDKIHQVAEFNNDHTRARIYNDDYRKDVYLKGNLKSLTLFPSDQILIARILADRQGCYLHSSGIILDGKGYLFAGRSGAGKTTILEILKTRGEVLCDDRMIVRKFNGDIRIYGTWSHGDLPLVSAGSAPLRSLLFLEQSKENRIESITDRNELLQRLLAVLIKPLVTRDWWEKTLSFLEELLLEVPCRILYFNRSDEVIQLLESLDNSGEED